MSVDVSPSYSQPMASEPLDSEVLYRAIPKWAVISLVLGILSVVAFLDPYLTLVPIVGILLGWIGLRQITKQPRDYTGKPLALAGISLSAAMLVSGVATQVYIYQTEVPEGYERISYTELQPPPFAPEGSVPRSALSLDGKQVFIKGYVYPTRQQTHIKKFVLCRDNGDCCFGGEPKLTDKILVELKDPLELTYSMRLFKLAGTFKVLPADSDVVGQVVYQLEADHLQ